MLTSNIGGEQELSEDGFPGVTQFEE